MMTSLMFKDLLNMTTMKRVMKFKQEQPKFNQLSLDDFIDFLINIGIDNIETEIFMSNTNTPHGKTMKLEYYLLKLKQYKKEE